MSINIGNLPIVTTADVRDNTGILVNTTDSNGLPYTGLLPISTLQDDAGCLCVKTATLTLTSAQILSGNTTPIAFGITPASGTCIRILSVSAEMDYQTTAYATNGILRIRTVGATYHQFQWSANSMLYGTVSRKVMGAISLTLGTTDTQLIADADIEAYVDSGDPTAGDSPVTLTVTYIEE